ncbi:C-type lectin domain family 5 member A-like [Lacerta agilis]|uniref:C-type lectin domain family 5 member A-like n=1 Tax=Lacerta agilis TaxID=80427 RepID=UPI00141A47EC|nr:C-type lectin domain family 5 member A-like [Lacerta agilis]
MGWAHIAPGIILLLVKLTGTSLFLVFIPQIFPRGNFSFIPEENHTEPLTTTNLPEVRVTIATTVLIPQKPPTWERNGGSEYWFTEAKEVWFHCRYDCMQWSSDLVIINDRKELEFIQKKTTMGAYFIGLTYAVAQNKWLWTDGTELRNNLFAMRPKAEADECATIAAGELKPVSCHQEHLCICEKNLE